MPDRPDLLFIGGPFDLQHYPDPRHSDAHDRIVVPDPELWRRGSPTMPATIHYRRVKVPLGGPYYVTVWTCVDSDETCRKVWAFMAKRSGLELAVAPRPVIL